MGFLKVETGCDYEFNHLFNVPAARTFDALLDFRVKAQKELNRLAARNPYVKFADPDAVLDAKKDTLWRYINWSEMMLGIKDQKL